jgi:hypothetical protein
VAEATEKTEAAETADQKCSKEGCKRPYRAKGYCVTHYKLWRRGEVEGHKSRYKICSKEACKKVAGRYGLCDEHRGTAPKEGEAPAPAAT